MESAYNIEYHWRRTGFLFHMEGCVIAMRSTISKLIMTDFPWHAREGEVCDVFFSTNSFHVLA